MVNPCRQALRRLMMDQEELQKYPVANVSAVPLDSDIMEWHCNIRQKKYIYHLVLYFPQNYPYSSPSAEFVPRGFNYNHGATKMGKKGDQICLSIFSDFLTSHREWTNEKGTGWSPGYTTQTVLLNVISLLAESNTLKAPEAEKYQKLCRSFHCQDCGHTFDQPYPSLETVQGPLNDISKKNLKQERSELHEAISNKIIDYSSKEKFQPSKFPTNAELFGYGLVVTKRGTKHSITTPCEFLTSGSFYRMHKSLGVAHSVMKEKLSHFLPIYINKTHGDQIKTELEKTLRSVKPILFSSKRKKSYGKIILELIPNLMCSTVQNFYKGSHHTSDTSLMGYFALHCLLLWAMDVYPEIEAEVEKRLSSLIRNPQTRTEDSRPKIGEWLMLLSVCNESTWESVTSSEGNAMWRVKTDKLLGYLSASPDYRLKRTLEFTAGSRDLLTFHVAFLDIAKPKHMSRKDIIERYEANLGFPSPEMISQMKTACEKITTEIKNHRLWYLTLGLSVLSEESLNEVLEEPVDYFNSTPSYFFKAKPPRDKDVTQPQTKRNQVPKVTTKRKEGIIMCLGCLTCVTGGGSHYSNGRVPVLFMS